MGAGECVDKLTFALGLAVYATSWSNVPLSTVLFLIWVYVPDPPPSLPCCPANSARTEACPCAQASR